jgi:hypothetical protein
MDIAHEPDADRLGWEVREEVEAVVIYYPEKVHILFPLSAANYFSLFDSGSTPAIRFSIFLKMK